MKFDNKMAKDSPNNAWFNWRGQFKSDAEALVCLLRVINSRVKNQRTKKRGIFTRKFTNVTTTRSSYKVKELALLYLETKGFLTGCYPENVLKIYTCGFCQNGCVVCDGKKHTYNKILYKKTFNIDDKVYAFHSILKSIDKTKLFNNKQTVVSCEFRDVDQINFNIKLASRSLEAAIKILTVKDWISVFSLKKLFKDSKESLDLLLSTEQQLSL